MITGKTWKTTDVFHPFIYYFYYYYNTKNEYCRILFLTFFFILCHIGSITKVCKEQTKNSKGWKDMVFFRCFMFMVVLYKFCFSCYATDAIYVRAFSTCFYRFLLKILMLRERLMIFVMIVKWRWKK